MAWKDFLGILNKINISIVVGYSYCGKKLGLKTCR